MSNKLITILFLFLGITALCFAQSVTLSSPDQIAAGNATQGNVKQVIFHFHLNRDNVGIINLTGVNFTTGGNYQASDLTRFQLWFSGADNISSAVQISSDITTNMGPGSHTFSSFSTLLAASYTRYLFVTADIALNATTSKYVNVSGWSTSNFIVSSGAKSGTAPAGGAQTITPFTTLATDYFRSNSTIGNWSSPGFWQSSHDNITWATATLSPSSTANTITVLSGHSVNFDTSISIDQTVINAGGQVMISNGTTLTIADGSGTDLTVNGTLRNNEGIIITSGILAFGSGGLYQCNFASIVGVIPTATWNTNSTCEIIGYTNFSGIQTGLSQNFGNFKWNCPDQTANITANSTLLTVKGNLEIAAGQFQLTATGTPSLALGGGLNISGGTLDMSSGTGNAVINLKGNFTMSGGVLTETGSGAANNINFSGTTAQVISITGLSTISNTINFAVNSSAIAEFETESTVLNGSIGTFTVNSGSTLIIRHENGIASTGNNSGCIQITGTRTFSSTATYSFKGYANQATGNGLPTTISNLIVNHDGGGVTLSGACTVTTALSLYTALSIDANTLTLNGTVPVRTGGIIGGNSSNLVIGGTASLTIPEINSGLQNLTINGNGAITLGNSVTIYNIFTLASSGNGYLSVGNYTLTINGTAVFNALSYVSGAGSFVLASGATLQTPNTSGITLSGTTGSVRTTTRIFNTDSNYSYNGTSAQLTGNGLPDTVHDLTTTNLYGVTISTSCIVNGTFTPSGDLFIGNNSVITVMGAAVFNTLYYVSDASSSASTFILSSGATLQTAHAAGITSSGATGSVRTTVRSFNSNANYTYNGTVAQVTGSGLPASVLNLTVSNAAGVTLSGSCAVNGVFTPSTGYLNVGNYLLNINGTARFNATNYVIGAGSFILANHATLETANVNGITTSGGGSVQTNTRIFNTNANYVFNGTTAQVTGNGLPGTVRDLTASNIAALTLSGSCNVNGTFTQSVGNLDVNIYALTINNTAIFNSSNYVFGAGSFALSNGAILQTSNVDGINMPPANTGSVRTTSRSFDIGANYTYSGSSTQYSGNGYPDLCTGTLQVSKSNSASFYLSTSRTIGTNGKINLALGTFAASTSLTMGTGSSIIRNAGYLSGTIQGNNAYSVTYIGNSKATGNELSGSGLGNITIDLNSGNTITLNRNLIVDDLEVLSFLQGSLALSNFNLTMNGSYSGANQFIYNGTGSLNGNNVGSNACIRLTVVSPSSLPVNVNILEVNPGEGNTITLPGDVSTATLLITDGSLGLNSHILTLAGKDFALQGSNSISALDVNMTSTSHTYNGYPSLAHTWQTSGIFSGALSIIFSYPSSLSTSSVMTVLNRDHVVVESNWNNVVTLSSVLYESNYSITLHNITTLNGAKKGDLDWTLIEPDQDLPVELTSFQAHITQDLFVKLQWMTQSETNLTGYNVFRSLNEDVNSAMQVNSYLIPATNTSVTHTYDFQDTNVTSDNTYYYWLQHIDHAGIVGYFGPVSITVNSNEIENPSPIIPLTTGLNALYPNPFTGNTIIRYYLSKDISTTIDIYNTKGQLVRSFPNTAKTAGNQSLAWDGFDNNGRTCSSGIYLVRMLAGKDHSYLKATLIK